MRRLLFPVELHSHELWKPAEELNLVPVRPALKVRFRRPMPGTRASSAALRLISACSAVKGFFHAEARRERKARREDNVFRILFVQKRCGVEAMVRFELTTCCLRDSRSDPIRSYIAESSC